MPKNLFKAWGLGCDLGLVAIGFKAHINSLKPEPTELERLSGKILSPTPGSPNFPNTGGSETEGLGLRV